MIKVTMDQILSVNKVLNKLMQTSYSGRVAFALARLTREVGKEAEVFSTTRIEVIRRYADKDENGELVIIDGNAHVSNDKLAECNKELSDMLLTEVEITIEPLDMEWFEKIELTVDEAMALEPFIK